MGNLNPLQEQLVAANPNRRLLFLDSHGGVWEACFGNMQASVGVKALHAFGPTGVAFETEVKYGEAGSVLELEDGTCYCVPSGAWVRL